MLLLVFLSGLSHSYLVLPFHIQFQTVFYVKNERNLFLKFIWWTCRYWHCKVHTFCIHTYPYAQMHVQCRILYAGETDTYVFLWSMYWILELGWKWDPKVFRWYTKIIPKSVSPIQYFQRLWESQLTRGSNGCICSK